MTELYPPSHQDTSSLITKAAGASSEVPVRMKYETFRCDACGVICTNRCETINGRDYCRSCLRNLGIEVYVQ